MKYFIFILTLFCSTSFLGAVQKALTLQAKPTAEELKQYWGAKFTGDQIIFDLIEKYGEQIVNKTISNETIISYAAANWPGWTLHKFEELLKTPGINLTISCAGRNPLTQAMFEIGDGDPSDKQLQKIILLIKYGVNIDQSDSLGFTPLISAARDKQPGVTRLLLDAGASTDGYITTGGNAGKNFFYYIQKNPEIQQVYESYRKEHDALIAERLGHINDLAQIVTAYIFTLSLIDYEVVNSALEKHNEEESRYGVNWFY